VRDVLVGCVISAGRELGWFRWGSGWLEWCTEVWWFDRRGSGRCYSSLCGRT
jgi:hypothetical protein